MRSYPLPIQYCLGGQRPWSIRPPPDAALKYMLPLILLSPAHLHDVRIADCYC